MLLAAFLAALPAAAQTYTTLSGTGAPEGSIREPASVEGSAAAVVARAGRSKDAIETGKTPPLIDRRYRTIASLEGAGSTDSR